MKLKHTLIAALAALTIGITSAPAMAVPAIGPAIFGAGIFATGWVSASEPNGQACDNEPLRLVAHKGNEKGYSFTVAGCDYQAKKDRLVLIRELK